MNKIVIIMFIIVAGLFAQSKSLKLYTNSFHMFYDNFNHTNITVTILYDTVQVTEPPLEIGAVYKIIDYHAIDDFTNCGALLNQNDIMFIAIAENPTIWSFGTVLIKITIIQ